MKKLLAVVLAVAMLLSLSIVAFAADVDYEAKATAYYSKKAFDADTTNVRPTETVYYAVDEDLANGDYFKFKASKDEGSKMIDSIKLVEKKNEDVTGASGRGWFVAVKMKDNQTDAETKIAFTVTFTAKEKYIEEVKSGLITDGTNTVAAAGDKVTFSGKFWVSNQELDGDRDTTAGTGKVVFKPTKNDDNEYVWEDANNTLAVMTMSANDNPGYFYPKLSTKWDNQTYADYFADQDAYLFDWVGNPSIPSTSRATLDIYNPYYDAEDDEYYVADEDIIIYEVDDEGNLTDVTAKFDIMENDDGDSVFRLKTRTLGTYIVCEAEATAAADDVVDAPVDETGKEIPNTGR